MRDKRTPKDVCGEASQTRDFDLSVVNKSRSVFLCSIRKLGHKIVFSQFGDCGLKYYRKVQSKT